MLECGKYIEMNPVEAGIVNNPGDYIWSSYSKYIGKEDKIVDYDPEYIGLSEIYEERKKLYKDYLEGGKVEKRSEGRFFKIGAYGNKEYIKKMVEKGLRPKWSKRGRPRKKRNEK